MTRDEIKAKFALQRAILKSGGPTKFAVALRVSPQRVYAWNRVPFKFIRKASKISGIVAREFVPEVS